MTQSELRAKRMYNAMGKEYEEAYGQNPHQIAFVRKSLDRLSITPSTTILDIGQGTGKPTSAVIAATGCKLYGIDVTEEMVRIASEQVPEGSFQVVSMLEYEPPFQFDAAFAIFSMFNLEQEEIEHVVPKWGDWIKPGGWLFVGTITGEDWPAQGVDFQPFSGDNNDAGWARLLKNGGFEIVEAEVLPFKPPERFDNSREPHYYITCKKASN